jgi:sulfur carrier protein
MMEITLNGQARALDENTTLAALITLLGQTPAALATAVNGSFVPRAQREACHLQPGDAVTTFQPITGG